MESLKSIWNNMSDMSKSLIKILLGIVCGLLALFMVVLIVRLFRGGTDNYTKIENTMKKAAEKYYKDNKGELPEIGEEATVTTETLANGEYMKPLSDFVKKNMTCSGNVTVVNNNRDYTYIPYLDCEGDYTTKVLADTIIRNTYRVLMTRGIKGCYVYACDKELQKYLKKMQKKALHS